jgi:hypothetical protein
VKQAVVTSPLVDDLRAQVTDLFATEAVSVHGDGRVVSFVGRLLADAEAVFSTLEQRLDKFGYLPMLSRVRGRDRILLLPAPAQKSRSRVWINVGLFLATVCTVTLGGALMEGSNPLADPPTAL